MKTTLILFSIFSSLTSHAQLNAYVCVSRDGDGRDPYTMGFRSGVDVKKIEGMDFANLSQCQDSLNSLRITPAGTIACVTRDSDGHDPWQLGVLDFAGGMKKINPSMTSDFSDCQNVLAKMIFSYREPTVLFCAARDDDAHAPFVAASTDLTTGNTQQGTDTFETMDACWSFLGY